MDRIALAALWHRRALVTRTEIFGFADEKLLPVAAPSQVEICVPGMVGNDYTAGGVAIVSVNPAGGRDGFRPTLTDESLYAAAAELRTSADLGAFDRLNDAFVAGMPSWGPQWRVIESILRATRKHLSEISYPYLVPFRSRGDAGSTLSQGILDRGYASGFQEIVAALRPGHIVAVDRPSERACLRLIAETSLSSELTYLTRKRDAHAERAATLDLLSQKF